MDVSNVEYRPVCHPSAANLCQRGLAIFVGRGRGVGLPFVQREAHYKRFQSHEFVADYNVFSMSVDRRVRDCLRLQRASVWSAMTAIIFSQATRGFRGIGRLRRQVRPCGMLVDMVSSCIGRQVKCRRGPVRKFGLWEVLGLGQLLHAFVS